MTLNDLEWPFHDKMRFWPALLESERLNVRIVQPRRLWGVLCISRSTYTYTASQLPQRNSASDVQLTRCFSAVAELLVFYPDTTLYTAQL